MIITLMRVFLDCLSRDAQVDPFAQKFFDLCTLCFLQVLGPMHDVRIWERQEWQVIEVDLFAGVWAQFRQRCCDVSRDAENAPEMN